jgi:hypothetical protein
MRDLTQLPYSAALSPDGEAIAVFRPTEITLHEAATGKSIRKWPVAGGMENLKFSSDGRLLAASNLGSQLTVWDTAMGVEVLSFDQRSRVNRLAFSPDGRFLATGTDAINEGNFRVRLWDVGTGQELRALSGHRAFSLPVAFSPDGRLLLSGSFDMTALVWDVADVTRRPPVGLSAEDRDRLWGALAGDAKAANKAIYALAAAEPDAVADLGRRLQPVPVAATPIDKLLADLDSDRFAVREEATKALERLGPAIEMEVRKALEGQSSAEARGRMERLLDGLRADVPRQRRAVAVLEAIGTLEARQVLRRLAGGAPGATLTREARAALDRLERGPKL